MIDALALALDAPERGLVAAEVRAGADSTAAICRAKAVTLLFEGLAR